MTLGEFKKWCLDNDVDDSTELYVSREDFLYPRSSLDSPSLQFHTIGIATRKPKTIAIVEFS